MIPLYIPIVKTSIKALIDSGCTINVISPELMKTKRFKDIPKKKLERPSTLRMANGESIGQVTEYVSLLTTYKGHRS